MIKASEAIGRQVTTRRDGREMGMVKDLVIDPTGQEVLAILLARGSLGGSRVVLWSAVQIFGPDTVVINAPASIVKLSKEPDVKAVLKKNRRITGLTLRTTHGHKLGKITDVAFDDTSGAITGYEFRSRHFSGKTDGNPFLPTPKWIELGKRLALIVPESMATIQSRPRLA